MADTSSMRARTLHRVTKWYSFCMRFSSQEVLADPWAIWAHVYHAVHRGETEARLLVLGVGPLEEVRLLSSGRRFDLGPERQQMADEACQRWRERGQTVTANPVYRLMDWTVGE